MKECAYCNTTIIFGGVQAEEMLFCGEKCRAKGNVLLVARKIPDDVVTKETNKIHQGSCPSCKGSGPVDVHTSHFVWSIIVLTSVTSKPTICCRSCGIKNQITSAIGSGLVGWWGFWGLLMTPVQIVKNIIAVYQPPDHSRPSDLLRAHVSLQLANEQLSQS